MKYHLLKPQGANPFAILRDVNPLILLDFHNFGRLSSFNKMKILLIGIQNAGARPGYSGLFLPFGLAYISAVLKERGHSVDCIDLHTEQVLQGKAIDAWETLQQYDLTQYNLVGFGGTFLNFQVLKELSVRIHTINSGIFQVAGGTMSTLIADTIIMETNVSCVCLHEGEDTITELTERLVAGRSWSDIPGICFKGQQGGVTRSLPRNKIDDLDRLPFPDRSAWSFSLIRKAFPYGTPGRYCAIAFASRGCPFSCVFCNPISGRKVRSRSPESIVNEIKYLKREWNVDYIRFFDEVFIGSKEKIKALCQLMISEKLNVFWWCQTQVRLVDDDVLNMMKQAGCIEISYGIESGSNPILKEMEKGITAELARDAIERTYKIGIRSSISLITGTPSETIETLHETRDFIKSLNHNRWTQIPSIQFIVPLPNTKLYQLAMEKGFIQEEKSYFMEGLFKAGKYNCPINLTQIPDDVFLRTVNECNADIRKDFYKKHPMVKVLSIFGLDHVRLRLLLRHFRLRHIKPVFEALLWATLGKRNNTLGRFLSSRFLYKP